MSRRKNNKSKNGTGWGHIDVKQEKDFGLVYSVLWFFNKNNGKEKCPKKSQMSDILMITVVMIMVYIMREMLCLWSKR